MRYDLLSAVALLVSALAALEAKGQTVATTIPDVAATARAIVADIHGTYSSPPRSVPSGSMPGGPVAGNGDVAIVLGGSPEHQSFYIGKADFFGVIRGGIMPVGSLALDVPELRNAAYHVDENIASATLAGKFTHTDGSELSLTSWVSATQNLIVIELNNTGKKPLTISSTLLDGFSTKGNPATFSKSENSTALLVSPDTVNVEIGNRNHGGKSGAFQGQIADVRIFDQALTDLSSLETSVAPKAFLQWGAGSKTPIRVKGNVSLSTAGPHGDTLTLTGDPKAEAWLGALCFPQKQFTISAWVQATTAQDQNFILSAMADPYHPRGYPYVRGVNLCLDGGKLSASLNQTTVAAADPFPLNRWVQVAATYDGTALTLYADGIKVGATTDFPTAQDVMGWQQNTIHFGDKDLPFSGCGPQGLMVQRVIGNATQEVGNQLNLLSLLPGEKVTLVVSVVTDRNTPDYAAVAQQLVRKADPASLAALYRAHTDWWTAFWSKSFIKIPDEKIQSSWYASLYLLACCSQPSTPPPGLWGNFVTMRDMGWQGDYTLNYNYEAPFWAAYPTNHLELADNYEKPLLDYIPRGLAIAQHEHQQGLFFYTHIIPPPGWDDDQSTFMKQKGCTLYALVNCAQRWKYTHDADYAKKIYPLLKGAADFWDNHLVLKNGKYVDLDDGPGEEKNGDNTTTTLAFIRLIYPCLLDLSQLLNVDADRRDKWNDILTNLSPFPIVPAATVDHIQDLPDNRTLQDVLGADVVQNKMVIRNSETGYGYPTPMIKDFHDQRQRTSSGGMNSSQAIFPAWAIGLESETSLKEAAFNTVDFDSQWFDANNDCAFYPAAACIGYDPKAILQHLDELLGTEFPSYIIPTRGGGTEDFAIVPATICAMFLQSYQQNIHLFPDWPMEQDASFGHLNACGGFLISSQLSQGRVAYVQIQSNAGQECRLVNPWNSSAVKITSSLKPAQTLSGPLLKFPTQRNEIIVLTPVL